MKKLLTVIVILTLSALALAGCKSTKTDLTTDEYLASFTAGEYGVQKNSDPIVEFDFGTYGKVRVELYPDVAPLSVANFLTYVDEGFYDGTVLHRVIKDFMIQGGGYYLDGNAITPKSTHSPIKGEFSANGVTNDVKHTLGVLSMARATQMDSATSQFFIVSATSPHLDGQYAAFGKIIDEESAAVVLALEKVNVVYVDAMFTTFPYPVVTLESVKVLKR